MLIFNKGGETNHVRLYDMQLDGYTLDDKRNKITESDLTDTIEKFRQRKSAIFAGDCFFSQITQINAERDQRKSAIFAGDMYILIIP